MNARNNHRSKRKLTGICLIVVLVLFLFLLGVLLVVPPFHNPVSAQLHGWLEDAGLRIYSIETYTGVVRDWDDEGRLRLEYDLVNGKRHGTWVYYEEDGNVWRKSEYRDDEPWDGICYLYPLKGWQGEYKEGRPWNGCLPVFDPQKNKTVETCFLDGAPMSEDDYKRELGIDGEGYFIGLSFYRDRK